MIILVNGKKAMLKSGFSFDYVTENRLFLGRDGYTLSMAFPLKDCPENVEIFGQIHRADVTKSKINFECSIISGKTSLFGTLSVVKVSETDVECQFSEGRCAQTVTNPFEDVFITELDLGCGPTTDQSTITPVQAWKGIDSGANEVALPWVNENSPSVPNNWVNLESNVYTWDSENRMLSWQPYLIVIAKRICDAIGYEYDFTEWEQSPMRHIIICNTLPGIWYMPEYAKVLPEWTVSEFFEKLELFLMCEFDFDHKAQAVKMSFSKKKLEKIAPVHIEDVVDSYGVEVSQDEHVSCDYIAAKRLAYKECSHSMQGFYSCDWYVNNCRAIKKYETLSDLMEKNKRKDSVRPGQITRVHWGEQMGDGWDPRVTTLNALLYAENVDTYFAFRSIGTEYLGDRVSRPVYTQIYVLQPVNVFGSGTVETDDTETEEIEFVPACIMDTFINKDDDKGYMLFLNPSSFDESSSDSDAASSGTRPGANPDYDPSAISQPGPASSISRGKTERASSYYDEIYVGYWDGTIISFVKTPFPIVDSVIIAQDWQSYHRKNFSMRLHGGTINSEVSAKTQLPQINARQKFKFSWLANEIPNPRATFFIKGKKYICEKITATFTENGMSQLLKGEFYPVLEED
jgi:hypothetical protein